jgi:hypothetical protein
VVKQLILIPIYWGDWWYPARHNAYNWLDVNGLVFSVLTGRYMDGLNQYGIGRGFVGGQWVKKEDPIWAAGFGDSEMQAVFKEAIRGGWVHQPDDFDLATQQPFYALMVKPGVEHLRDATPDGTVAQDTPDVGTGAYHFGFTYEYGDGRPNWNGQACWVKSGTSATETLGRLVHEMAEAYAGKEVSDLCQFQTPVVVHGVTVPQYWSAADNSCWPPSDSARIFTPRR